MTRETGYFMLVSARSVQSTRGALAITTVLQWLYSGCSSRTDVRDLRFLAALEMTEKPTGTCFRCCDAVSYGSKQPNIHETAVAVPGYESKPKLARQTISIRDMLG